MKKITFTIGLPDLWRYLGTAAYVGAVVAAGAVRVKMDLKNVGRMAALAAAGTLIALYASDTYQEIFADIPQQVKRITKLDEGLKE